jgi:hypothetical protein
MSEHFRDRNTKYSTWWLGANRWITPIFSRGLHQFFALFLIYAFIATATADQPYSSLLNIPFVVSSIRFFDNEFIKNNRKYFINYACENNSAYSS